MTCAVNHIPGRPIIVISLSDPFDPAQNMVEGMQQFVKFANEIPGRVFRLIDIGNWSMHFSDLVVILAKDTREGVKVGADPRIATVLVGSGDLVKLGVTAGNQKQYGYGTAPQLFGSMDEALAYIDAELAKAAK